MQRSQSFQFLPKQQVELRDNEGLACQVAIWTEKSYRGKNVFAFYVQGYIENQTGCVLKFYAGKERKSKCSLLPGQSQDSQIVIIEDQKALVMEC